MIYLDSLIKQHSFHFQTWRKNNPIIEHAISHEMNQKYQNIKYVYLRRYYFGIYQENSDLFGNIIPDSLDKLKNEKDVILIFDTFFEGDSNIEVPCLKALHYNCEKYGVDPKKIFYLTSNEKDPIFYNQLCEELSIKDKITICAHSFFEAIWRAQYAHDTGPEKDVELHFKECVDEVYKNYTDKFFASLSNKTRIERAEATFLLCQTPIRHYGLISHKSIDDDETITSNLTKKYGSKFVKWSNTLPLTLDNIKIDTMCSTFNSPFDKTLFHIVNETLVSDYNNTSQFISEKTFRPMLCFQPFVIYGQPNIHKILENKGYKLFHNLFDYSFDSESDYVKRYKKLLNTVTDAVNHLKTLSRDKQLLWRFDNKAILMHNVLNLRREDVIIEKINNSLKQLLLNNNLGD